MNTGLIVLLVMLGVCLLTGLLVTLSIGISCMALLAVNGYPPLDAVAQRMVSDAKSFNMMVMSMFISTNSLMVYGNTPRLMKSANMMLRKIPGGLGATVLAAYGFSGAVSGSGVTGAAAIGKVIGPEILEQKHPRGLTVGLVAAGGTTACIIPSSIIMAVYASSSEALVGDMFLAGFVPGFICIIVLIGFNAFLAVKRGNKESVEKTGCTAKERLRTIGDALFPLLTSIFMLGGVFSGICIAIEASVMAIIYFFIPAASMYRELTLREFYKVAAGSVVTIGVIMLIISVATPSGWIMSIQNVPTLLAGWLLSITSSKFLIVAFMSLLPLLLGTFMEIMCIVILVTPILLPIVQTLGMGVVHYGISTPMTLIVGSLIPSLSVDLFTACRVLNVEYDGAFPDTLRATLTVTVYTFPTFTVPEITELLLVALK